MKILCDVCSKEEASVFCCADEAALCRSCDRRVHRANKLAGKHRRFSLLNPSSSPSLSPRCDICQEKRAFLFCQEDRAILCKDCDGSIHAANELTMKHNRFLLTGVKISPTATAAEADCFEEEEEEKAVVEKQAPDLGVKQSGRSPCSSCNNQSSDKVVVIEEEEEGVSGNGTAGAGSSISDYLMKTLPGWRVDDLLLDLPSPVSSFPFSNPVFYKMGLDGEDALPFVEADVDASCLGTGDAPIWWVPQVPQVPPPNHAAIGFHHGGGIAAAAVTGAQQRWRSDDAFTVPQIVSQQPPCNKRPRTLWYT